MKKTIATLLIAGLVGVSSTTVFADEGEKIYNKSCKMCHSTGMLGAPKTSDKAAWKARLSHYSKDDMVTHTIKGFGKMRPRGGCKQCTDEQIKEAVEFMLDH